MGTYVSILKDTFQAWNEDKAPRLAAALSYYAIFSLAPLLLLVIGIAGIVIDPQEARDLINSQIGNLVGPAGADLISDMVDQASENRTSVLATVLGGLILIFGATGVFVQLQDALNTIWNVAPDPDKDLMHTIRSRFLSLAMIAVIGFLLLVSLVVSAALQALNTYFSNLLPGMDLLWQLINIVVSIIVISFLFAAVFKILPDARIRWRDVWVGALVTALLFSIGKYLIGLYLGQSSAASVYGAAGSLVIILLWVYYSSLIVFFGAEFTQVYARRSGSRIEPDSDAVALDESARLNQGIPRREQVEHAAAQKERREQATSERSGN